MLGKDPQKGLKGINHQETAEKRARFLMFVCPQRKVMSISNYNTCIQATTQLIHSTNSQLNTVIKWKATSESPKMKHPKLCCTSGSQKLASKRVEGKKLTKPNQKKPRPSQPIHFPYQHDCEMFHQSTVCWNGASEAWKPV